MMGTTTKKRNAIRSDAPGFLFLITLCVSLSVLAVAASPALGQRALVGQIAGLSEPAAASFDGNGEVWVSAESEGQAKILEYGAFPSQRRLSSLTSVSGSISNSIAVNNSTGFLYVGNNESAIEVFDNTGSLSAQWPVPSVGCFPRIAIDNSGGPSAGVAYIDHCNTSGEYIEAVNANDEPADFSYSASYITANHITGTPAGPLGRVIDVATDSHGDLYAVEVDSNLIDEFKPSGEFVRSFALPSVFESTRARGLAVDPSTGDLLIADIENDVIYELSPSGEYLGLIKLPQSGYSGGVAVNPEGYVYVPVAGSLYIYATSAALPTITYGRVSEQTSTGGTLNAGIEPDGAGEIVGCYFQYGPVDAYAAPYNSSHVPCAPTTPYSAHQDVSAAISGLASETRYHYRAVVTEAGGQVANGPEQLYTPHLVDGLETEPPTRLEPGTARLAGSLIGNGEPTKYYFEWGTDTSYGEKTPEVSVGSPAGPARENLSAEITALAFEAVYHYRVVAVTAQGTSYGEDVSFKSSGAVPGLTTESPTNITAEGATLNGSLIGDGEPTTYFFEWGTSASYGEATPQLSAGSPNGPQPISLSAALTGLHPVAVYHYRVVASDGFGVTYGEDRELTTLPLAPVLTESVSGVQSDLAVLHASINPGGGETRYRFEYATQEEYEASNGYGHASPEPDGSIEPGFLFENVSTTLSGLQPGTVYHWRVVATNANGTTSGPDRTFTTYTLGQGEDSCPNAHVRQQTSTASLLDCRAYELVSAADSGGYDVESDLIEGQTPYPGFPEADHPSSSTASARVLYGVHDGGIPGTKGSTDKGSDPYVATRSESGWTTEYVGVPAENPFSDAPFTSVPSGADANLETFAFGAAGGCSPCFEGGYTGVPVHLPDGRLAQGMVGPLNPGPGATQAGFVAQPLSSNGEHFVFGSASQFAAGANTGGTVPSIYDHNLRTGETHAVSNDAAGDPLPCLQSQPEGGCQAPDDPNGIAELGISADGADVLVAQKVSEDPAHDVYWHLYMDIGDSPRAVDLTPGATDGVLFDGMTADGSKVFISSEEHLTNQDAGHSGAAIYMWSREGEEQGQPLTLISRGQTEGSGQPGDTASCDPVPNSLRTHWNATGNQPNCGAVAIGGGGGVSSGNGTIYFLSPERLAGTSNESVPDAPNLYVARPGSAYAPHYVATLESSLTGPYPPKTSHSFKGNFGAFSNPEFVAVDNSGGPSSGDVYVADTTTSAIYKYDSSHQLITAWGEHGKLTPNTTEIEGIAVGPSGTLDVFASGNIFEYAQNGTLQSTVKIDPSFQRRGEFFQPTGMAVDSAGNFYLVTEEYPYTEQENVEKFSSSGKFLGQVTTGLFVTGLAVDPSNNDLYVINEGKEIDRYAFNGSGEVHQPAGPPCPLNPSGFLPGCGPTEVFAAELVDGRSLAVDDSHDVYFDEGDRVVEFGSSGKQVSLPIGAGHLGRSTSVAVDLEGDLYTTNPPRGAVALFGPPEPSQSPATDNPVVIDSVSAAGVRHTADFQVTPDGQFAAFPSTLPLTGFESAGHPEVFRFDADAESLACASCDPTGVEPTGDSQLASNGLSLTDDGRLFFTSAEPLVERDGDGRRDIYEWEAPGTGPEAAPCEVPAGCVDLVSTGVSAFDSSLLGVSANGVDAYFFSRDKLVSQAEGGNYVKFYDARELGGFEYVPAHIPCKASDECHGPSSPAPPPSNIHVNTGVSGNQAEGGCKKGFLRRNGKCTKARHKHHKQGRRRQHRRHGRSTVRAEEER